MRNNEHCIGHILNWMIKIDFELIMFKITDKNPKYNSKCRRKEK